MSTVKAGKTPATSARYCRGFGPKKRHKSQAAKVAVEPPDRDTQLYLFNPPDPDIPF
jgi:hypothetical protein